jgi:hypothetical protein
MKHFMCAGHGRTVLVIKLSDGSQERIRLHGTGAIQNSGEAVEYMGWDEGCSAGGTWLVAKEDVGWFAFAATYYYLYQAA